MLRRRDHSTCPGEAKGIHVNACISGLEGSEHAVAHVVGMLKSVGYREAVVLSAKGQFG